jgi:hypothetical protein
VAASAFPLPDLGDIVYCRFPQNLGKPGPKPRPALVIGIGEFADHTMAVVVAYGTSQKTNQLHSGEFLISPADGAAYQAAGLSYPTKFNLTLRATVPYTDEWFRVPSVPAFGQTPKMGFLHPRLMHRAQAAAAAANPPESI